MAYFRDLTEYAYGREPTLAGAINVGWLSRWHRFPRGRPPAGFTDGLLDLCFSEPANIHAGYHDCSFCLLRSLFHRPPIVYKDGRQLMLGSCVLSVTHQDGTVFACPNLIYHYVRRHRYLPPSEFVEAVMQWKQRG
jgi:hypothetical protein